MGDEHPTTDTQPPDLFDAETLIENAIKAYDKETDGDGALLTGWVIVAEWVDSNGDPNLTAFARQRMPYWRIQALLDEAPHQIVYDTDDDDD